MRDRARSGAPPLRQLLRAGTVTITLSLVVVAAVAIATVVLSQRVTDELTTEIGPTRLENGALLRALVDAETELRGYQVTADPVTLELYQSAEQRFESLIDSLRARTDERDEWMRLIDEQARIGAQWFDEFAPTVIEVVDLGPPGTRSTDLVIEGKSIVDRFRTVNTELERLARAERERVVDRIGLLTVVAVATIVVFLAAVLFVLAWRARRVHRLVGVPLERLVGRIDELRRGRRATPVEVAGSSEVEAVAQALEELATRTAELRDADRDRLQRERRLRELTHRVREMFGQQAVLDRAVLELGVATGADRAMVLTLDRGGHIGELIAEWSANGVHPLGAGRVMPTDPQRDGVVQLVVRDRQTLDVADVRTSERLREQTRELLGRLRIGSFLLVPVIVGDEPIAALVLGAHDRPHEWSFGDAEMVEAVGDELATALAHARLYERESEVEHRLRDLDEDRFELVASLSGELREPLESLREHVTTAAVGDPASQTHLLGGVQRDLDRVVGIVADLATLTRIDADTGSSARSPIGLAGLANAVAGELAPTAAQRRIVVAVAVDDDVPPVAGDAEQLHVMVRTLLSIALGEVPDGGRVEVRAWDDLSEVVLEVRPRGRRPAGLAPVEEFGGAPAIAAERELGAHGVNLPLAIVERIVVRHGGSVAAHSRSGSGRTFTVRLPAAHPQTAAEPA